MTLLWDFNENKNYTVINNYKVIISSNSVGSSNLLEKIDKLIKLLKIKLLFSGIADGDKHIKLLVDTPYDLQEMQLVQDQGAIIFEGLNKPKGVHKTNEVKIGKDSNYRADYRRIFLTLKHQNGKLKTLNELKPLIAHELTHTALNHVSWEDDNHSYVFKRYNRIILRYLKHI